MSRQIFSQNIFNGNIFFTFALPPPPPPPPTFPVVRPLFTKQTEYNKNLQGRLVSVTDAPY